MDGKWETRMGINLNIKNISACGDICYQLLFTGINLNKSNDDLIGGPAQRAAVRGSFLQGNTAPNVPCLKPQAHS